MSNTKGKSTVFRGGREIPAMQKLNPVITNERGAIIPNMQQVQNQNTGQTNNSSQNTGGSSTDTNKK